MSKEFYDFIAKHMISFFKTIDGSIHNGERYILSLDNQEMVDNLDKSLYDLIGNELRGIWSYNDGEYDTYTLKLNNVEIAIVSKSYDMTEDYLATLRNAKMTMVMITASPIDSIKKGAGDLTANGMPFHKDKIIQTIKEYIQGSPLSKGDKSVLNFELERKKEDIFSDKYSLFEYKSLLSIVYSEQVTPENFNGFRLFYDDQLMLCTGEKELRIRLKENNIWYERIDQSMRFGNVEDDFEKVFDIECIKNLNIRKKNLAKWDEGLTYNDIIKSLEKKKKAKEDPLEEIEHQFYANSPLEFTFDENKNLFIRPDGNSPSKQRKQNILMFNNDKKDGLVIELSFNRTILKNNVTCNNGQAVISGRIVCFYLERNNCSCTFHGIKIEDGNSTVKYEYRICVIDIVPDYLQSTLTSYSIVSKRKSGFIRLLGSNGDIIINSSRTMTIAETISEGKTYSCNFDSALRLHIDENMMTDENQEINITLDLGGVGVPICVVDEPKVKVGITGLQVFKRKFEKKINFIVVGENTIKFGTEEFYTKEDFRQNLIYEQEFVDKGLYCASRTGKKLTQKTINISDTIKEAYDDFIFYFRSNKLIPSLSYYSNDLINYAQRYVAAVFDCMKSVKNGLPISDEINDLLKLGTLWGEDDAHEICLTPFHPLNVAYQLTLMGEIGIGSTRDELASKLSCANLLPYIKDENKKLYRVMEQNHSLEWVYYAPIYNKRFKGARTFVPKLVAEKIEEYINHFSCLFTEIDNKTFLINVINMGDCKEVMYGLIRHIAKSLYRNPEPNELIEFIVNIYGERSHFNEFISLADLNMLKKVYNNSGVRFDSNLSEYDIINIISKKIKCYFHSEDDDIYNYAHIAFYEMDSNDEPSIITSYEITSGIMLDGILSGVPSVFYGSEYKTGFGTKFAKATKLLNFTSLYNSLQQVANTSNPYYKEQCISTAIEKVSVEKMNKIYDSSNWVTFIDPKVDLNFFRDNNNSNIMIIHYSDQYTSSSGYDAITVTRKSKQYEDIISSYLHKKAVPPDEKSVHQLIDMFNAINGDWLLRLISSNSQFPREKMSILSAVKTALAYYYHPKIIWVPISLEELLRVSGAIGLSANDGLLSAKKLGFNNGKTSDDILLIGIESKEEKLFVYLHPVEVKIGHIESMIEYAKKQLENTSKGLLNALWPDENNRYSLENKMIRNFIMQLTVISSEKMKLYHIWDEQSWDKILVDYREDLLNENYEISTVLDSIIGHGTIIAFNHDSAGRSVRVEEDFEIIEMTEYDGVYFMVKSVSQIKNFINEQDNIFGRRLLKTYTNNDNNVNIRSDESKGGLNIEPGIDISKITNNLIKEEPLLNLRDETSGSLENDISEKKQRIEILFGIEQRNGERLIWEPGNTDKVLHTNMGIIGTMGTGKTQFTKSIITQLYRETSYNVLGKNIGILIFDYKGDYNESKKDFITATNATVFNLYHLPYNPLTLSQPKVFKPLLPIHVANSFKDTLSKVYSLGPKQENILFNCIKEAYTLKGISHNDRTTWDKTPPTFGDIYKIYSENNEIKKNDSLAAALDKLAGFEIFENDSTKTKSLFDILNGVVVIDLSGYDPDIQNLVVAITLDLFYAQMQSSGSSALDGNYRQLTKMLLVDEADNFLHGGFPSLKKILKEGREFGVGTILSTQFLRHFGVGDDDFSKYILTWVVHNVADLKPTDVRFVFNTEANSPMEQKLFNDVKKLDKHFSIVKMGNSSQPFYIRDKAFWELISE